MWVWVCVCVCVCACACGDRSCLVHTTPRPTSPQTRRFRATPPRPPPPPCALCQRPPPPPFALLAVAKARVRPDVPCPQEPNFPLIRDADDVVMSLPPIINSRHSQITLDTKNIFIEATAVDEYKANVCINQIIAAFSYYCKEQFTVEPVTVKYADGRQVGPGTAPSGPIGGALRCCVAFCRGPLRGPRARCAGGARMEAQQARRA